MDQKLSTEPQQAKPVAVALIVAFTMFVGILEGTVIATAMPDMARDFGIRPLDLSAGITAYLLVAAIFLPISSWTAGKFGARRVFTIAIVGFAFTSLVCGMSTSLPMFIAARSAQAFCSSLMVPVGNLVLLQVTPKRDLVSIMALSTTPALIAPVIGPPIGGFITTAWGWQWIFFSILPLALIVAGFAWHFIPDLGKEAKRRFDTKGFLLTAPAIASFVFGLDRLGAHPDHWQMPVLILIAAVGLTIMAVRHALSAEAPLVPLAALRHQSFRSMALGGGFLIRLPFMGQSILLPLYFLLGFGFTPFETGILLLAQNAGDLILKPIAGKALRWMGFRIALLSGTITMMAGIGGCALLDPSMPFWLLCAAMFVVGMARSIGFTAMMTLAFADVTEQEMGGATVLNNLANSISAALGISLAALILNSARLFGAEGMGPLADYRITILLMTALGAAALIELVRLPADAGAEVSGARIRRGAR